MEVEGKVIVPGYDIVGSGIFGCLHDLKVNIYGNDSYQAVRWQKAATMWMHFATKTGPGEQVLKAMDDIEDARKFRAQSILKGPFGLAKAQGRRYQVVTDDRVNAILQPYLESEKLRYAVVLPSNPPSKDLVKTFHEAVDNLYGSDEKVKLAAIDVIAATPIRGALLELEKAKELPRHSKEVRAYALQTLEVLRAAEQG